MLDSLELENFKSYKGKMTIGPFYKFTAIIGPNGSGKSNLMDAICFVLGEKASALRVRKLSELIHGSNVGKPASNRCSVTMVFKNDDGTTKRYTRRATTSGGEYLIDGVIVSVQEYNKTMEDLKLFIRAKNFLVYQGQVESVATKTPKERTAMFEEISRSNEFAAEYDRLRVEVQQAEKEAAKNLTARRGIAFEKREAKLEREEAEKYQQQKDELSKKQGIVQLMELFRVENHIKGKMDQLKDAQKEVEEATEKKDQHDREYSEKNKALKKAHKDQQKLEQECAKKEAEITQKKPAYVEARQQVAHQEKKLELSKKGAEAAKRAAVSNEEELKKWQKTEKELREKRTAKVAELDAITQDSQLSVSEADVAEYFELQTECGKTSGAINAQLASLQKEDDQDNRTMEVEQKKLKISEEKLAKKNEEIETLNKQARKAAETIDHYENKIKEDRAKLVASEKDAVHVKVELEKIGRQRFELQQKMSEAQVDSHESERDRKKKEALDALQRIFPEKVMGRVIDLCTIQHKRYHVAVTKVMQKEMQSIVVDTYETACECINYLKDQRYERERFLALDKLDVPESDERLKNIKEPKGAKPISNVVQTSCLDHKKAVHFVCRNIIVCETAADARHFAYGDTPYRNAAVSLDGTMFVPNGAITGGASELKRTARKWDEAALRGIKDEYNKIDAKFKELRQNRITELGVETLKSDLVRSEGQLKNAVKQRKEIQENFLAKVETEKTFLENEVDEGPIRIEALEDNIQRRASQIKKLKKESDQVADRVYADFCRRINVANVREFEDRHIKLQEDRNAALQPIDDELERVKLELDHLKTQDKQKKAETEKDKVAKLEKSLKIAKADEKKKKAELATIEEQLGDLQVKLKEQRASMADEEAAVADAKKEHHAAVKALTNAEKAVAALESAVTRLRHERHDLLHSAKINQITIPLSAGSMLDVDGGNDTEEEDEDEPMETDDDESTSRSQRDHNVTQVSREQLKREEKIKINFKALPSDYSELADEEEMKKKIAKMNREIAEVQEVLSKVQAPSLKAGDRLEEVKQSEMKANDSCERARVKAQKVKRQFEKIKTDRYRRFNDCFEPIEKKIDEIYKLLSRDGSAQAFLGADNMEEPYLEGIQYNCIAPGKRFRPMDNLSGGEKTVAALALLFAMHSRNPSPFFVLDEIDAALDNTNIGKVASFIMDSASEMQLIVISLKEEFYNKADALVGIYPIPANCTVSGVLTMDLCNFRASAHESSMAETSIQGSTR